MSITLSIQTTTLGYLKTLKRPGSNEPSLFMLLPLKRLPCIFPCTNPAARIIKRFYREISEVTVFFATETPCFSLLSALIFSVPDVLQGNIQRSTRFCIRCFHKYPIQSPLPRYTLQLPCKPLPASGAVRPVQGSRPENTLTAR